MLKKAFDNVMTIIMFYRELLVGFEVFSWYKLFKESRERVEDDERFGSPSTSIKSRI